MLRDQLPDEIPTEELLRIYLTTGRENLTVMSEAVQSLGLGANDTSLAVLQRLSHNMKGSSYQFGFPEPGHVAAGIELLIAQLLQTARPLLKEDLSTLAEGLACLKNLLESLEKGAPLGDSSAVCARLQARAQ